MIKIATPTITALCQSETNQSSSKIKALVYLFIEIIFNFPDALKFSVFILMCMKRAAGEIDDYRSQSIVGR